MDIMAAQEALMVATVAADIMAVAVAAAELEVQAALEAEQAQAAPQTQLAEVLQELLDQTQYH
jgi:hypothetical protein